MAKDWKFTPGQYNRVMAIIEEMKLTMQEIQATLGRESSVLQPQGGEESKGEGKIETPTEVTDDEEESMTVMMGEIVTNDEEESRSDEPLVEQIQLEEVEDGDSQGEPQSVNEHEGEVEEDVVHKLNLEITKHPQPYTLQWLNQNGEVKVEKQCLVSFVIGRYVDKVVCDVVPMEATHLLLGGPWQYDRIAMHDGYENKYTLTHLGQKHVLAPMTPQKLQVYENMVREKEKERRKRKMRKPRKKIENKQKKGKKNLHKALKQGYTIYLVMFKEVLICVAHEERLMAHFGFKPGIEVLHHDEDSGANLSKGGEYVVDNRAAPTHKGGPQAIQEGSPTRGRAKRFMRALLSFIRENVLRMGDQAKEEQLGTRLINHNWVDLAEK
jgi:hypothetical protein